MDIKLDIDEEGIPWCGWAKWPYIVGDPRGKSDIVCSRNADGSILEFPPILAEICPADGRKLIAENKMLQNKIVELKKN